MQRLNNVKHLDEQGIIKNMKDSCVLHRNSPAVNEKKQYRQCTYNAIMRCVRESLLLWKSNIYYIFVCVRARERVGACRCPSAWQWARAYTRVTLLIQNVTRMRHIVTSFVAPLASPHFSTLSHKRRDFRKRVTAHEMSVLTFSTSFNWNILILRRIQRDTVINVETSSCKLPIIPVRF